MAGLLGGLWIPGLNGWSAAIATPVDPKTVHLLNRLSYGPRPGDWQKINQLGVERYLQQQLNPNTMPEPVNLGPQLARLETLQMSPVTLFQEFNPRPVASGLAANPQLRQQNRQRSRVILSEAVAARLLWAIHSDRQLEAQMTDFWFNHLNVFSGKGLTRLWIGNYEQQVIRPRALGKFRDLLGASAKPANNATDPQPPFRSPGSQRPNFGSRHHNRDRIIDQRDFLLGLDPSRS